MSDGKLYAQKLNELYGQRERLKAAELESAAKALAAKYLPGAGYWPYSVTQDVHRAVHAIECSINRKRSAEARKASVY